MSADFLVEIGTEELPPKALHSLSDAFGQEISQRLKGLDLNFTATLNYAAPRRLAVQINSLDAETPDKNRRVWGPPVNVAFNDGHPTKAAEAFAAKNGIPIDELQNHVDNDGKVDKLCYKATEPGVAVTALLPDIVEAALAALPIPKRMRWGDRREEFVRPVHWVVMLYGDSVVEGSVLGLPTGNTSQGHRFHCDKPVVIPSPNAYQGALRAAYVMVNFAERRHLIRQGVEQAAANAGGAAVIDDDLLDEVTALNEWPVPLVGKFEMRFLDVPAEALVSSMQSHQKYFPVVDASGKLMPLFVTVANIESKDAAQVIAGNEKVIRPRLADAAFFYETDKKTPLSARREQLKTIVFQKQLGTLFDKTERVAVLAERLAPALGATPGHAKRAAELSKSDLVSDMVGEFDELQGTMGRYYAINDGEPAEVAEALFEQYLPRFAGDRLPETATGTALALADRLDTLTGIFGIGQPPSGSKDPFALRRASLGVLRILVEKAIDLDLLPVLEKAASLHPHLSVREGLEQQVLTYLTDRFRAWYEEQAIAAEVFAAVHAKSLSNPLDIHQRVLAVEAFSRLPEAQALAAANKRVSNILAKAKEDALAKTPRRQEELLEKGAERELASALDTVSQAVAPLIAKRDYTAALQAMAVLKEPVDNFFDQVMVMVDNPATRNHRLALLAELRHLFLQIADISQLVPAKA